MKNFMTNLDAYLERVEADETESNVDTGDTEIQKKIVEFFQSNPSPEDDAIHKFAGKEGINKHAFEEIIYKLLGSILSGGKGKGKTVKDFDPEEVKMGRIVESEHSDNPLIQDIILVSHLVENPKYYSEGKAKGLFPELK